MIPRLYARRSALVMALGLIVLLSQACDDPATPPTPTPPPPTTSPTPTQIPPISNTTTSDCCPNTNADSPFTNSDRDSTRPDCHSVSGHIYAQTYARYASSRRHAEPVH